MAKRTEHEPLTHQTNGAGLYQAIGGQEVCRKLSEAFYGRVHRDPMLRPFFPGKSLRCAIEAFTAFLAQFLGGPPEHAQHRWWLSLHESHQRFKIGHTARNAWMKTMLQALDEVAIAEPARSTLRGFFERSSAYLVNTGRGSADPGETPEMPADGFHEEISRRWAAQRRLDDAVAALHGGEAARAIAFAEDATLQSYFLGSRTACCSLLGQMIASRNTALLDYVKAKIDADPSLAHQRYSGRTLLHAAAAAGCLPMVELLLHHGSDPDVRDSGGHTPLYCLANQCGCGGGDVVRALTGAGADVNAHDGVKHCTALHMAARRDHVQIAAALLDCGADIEARDSLGDTPLRRAVNCNQTGVASLLLTRGAHRHSKGSKGLTPRSAARTDAMRRLMQSRG